MENQNKEIATTCYQTLANTTDIKFELASSYDIEMLIGVISAIIKGIRKKQHEATKCAVMQAYEDCNGLDDEVLETIKMPDIEL